MASPPDAQSSSVLISAERARRLDLAPLTRWADLAPSELQSWHGHLQLHFEWPREAGDPRELSEIPELRLWCLRADALHPWLPLLLERSGGGLTLYVAMLLPHAFNRNEGIRFPPESLELWITHRLFLLDAWAQSAGLPCRQGLGQMAAVLGFELDPQFWTALDKA